jgi:hypothetical protein
MSMTNQIAKRRIAIMKLKSITFVLLFGLWTTLTLGGSIWGFIFMRGPNSVTHLHVFPLLNLPLHLMISLAIFLCGGGLWGLGIARLMNGNMRSMILACALSWSSTVLAFYLSGGGGFGGINIMPNFKHYEHYNFLAIFAAVIGIITAINVYVVTGKLGFKELRKSVGLYTGLAAALGFLAVGLILLYAFGEEVGKLVPGKHGMLLIFLICSIGAALTGGMALGWMLEKSRIRHDLSEGANNPSAPKEY